MTEAEIEAVLTKFTPREREVIQEQRRQLTAAGVTREPLRTEMACEFAEVLLAQWRCHAQPPPHGRPCGFLNETASPTCAGCGCTRIASDARLAKATK